MKLTLNGNIIQVEAETMYINIRIEVDKTRIIGERELGVADIYLEKAEAKTLATAIIEATRAIGYMQH